MVEDRPNQFRTLRCGGEEGWEPRGGHRRGTWGGARLGRSGGPHARRARCGLRRIALAALHDAGGLRRRGRAAPERGCCARRALARGLVADLIVTLKYVLLVLRADNRGEGGVLALGTLAARRSATGAAACRGWSSCSRWPGWPCYRRQPDHPAISVLAAVEGLSTAASALEPYVCRLQCPCSWPVSPREPWTASVGAFFGRSCWPGSLPWLLGLPRSSESERAGGA